MGRYMGCTPVAYGAGANTARHRVASGDGKEFVFYSSGDDEENSLLSDEEYDTEDQGTDGVLECFSQDEDGTSYASGMMALRNTDTYREEDIEMGIEDLVLVNQPV